MRLEIQALIVATIVAVAHASAFSGYTKVPLKSIQTITLYPDQKTNARRTSPIPQLTCVGSACRQYEQYVEVVQCSNMGNDGSGNIQWRCQTDLPSPLKLGRVEVSCEGWSGPDDTEVLQGSCGLTYTLVKPSGDIDRDPKGSHKSRLDSFLQFTFNLLFFSILAFILYSILNSCMRERRASSDGPGRPGGGGNYPGFNGGGGHGGGGGGGGNDPPPPYDPNAKPSSGATPTPAPSTSRGGLGGFWTGLGLGGAGAMGAAYLANQRRERERYYREQDPGYGGIGRTDRWDSDRGEWTSRWGWDRQPGQHHPGRSNGSGGSSNLGDVRTTSGFGGSSVR
ncbi:Protein of unknown function DUF1183, TMEM66 [Phaffia rhodozyma]|uniref:Store-operated calcium entry-associated regulatory factor n=1 Tax=Phaffia rhodozyma TaxID=264483 RepID=A0A0F7SUA0_PHARH|nr:Protein of unknown function DUF1183, TMEM66 [Phaffia rhodozyma]